MWFSKIILENIKSFTSTEANFNKGINILVGPNNSGKSTILNTLIGLQHQTFVNLSSDTYPIKNGWVKIFFEDIGEYKLTEPQYEFIKDFIKLELSVENKLTKWVPAKYNSQTIVVKFKEFDDNEPNNLLIPFLTKRRNVQYNEQYSIGSTKAVSGNHSNLYSKIQLLSNAYEDGHELYNRACMEIFGHPISVLPVQHGVKAGYRIGPNLIPLTAMGEGVPQLLGFIVELCRAKNKVFLIEEPENDIHPKALKALLNLIEEKSVDNQFFISTHSNIVVKYLGANPATKIHSVSMEINETTKEPESTITEVENCEEARRKVLEELGYEFYDYGLWKGWLLLEESSAEKIINQFLIPYFIPQLANKLRTICAESLSQVEAKFSDFKRLFTFLHLQPIYEKKAWVIVDGGSNEEAVINKLKTSFTTWPESHFQQFKEHDFEKYYPSLFKDKVDQVLAITDKTKREGKRELLNEVIEWGLKNPEDAKTAFETSAKEVIEKLIEIANQLD